MSKTRAIRLSEHEDQRIRTFLKRNPMFDFSTLARTALASFIENPKVDLLAVKKSETPKRKARQ